MACPPPLQNGAAISSVQRLEMLAGILGTKLLIEADTRTAAEHPVGWMLTMRIRFAFERM